MIFLEKRSYLVMRFSISVCVRVPVCVCECVGFSQVFDPHACPIGIESTLRMCVCVFDL